MKTDGTRGLTTTTWSALDACLKGGHRGLPGGSSLAKALLAHRGRRHKGLLPPLTPDLILTWADAHHARTCDWPTPYSGPVADAPGETWAGAQHALVEGARTLPGGSSVARLLEEHRGVRNHLHLPPLVPEHILAWADAHHARTGRWPHQADGPVADAPGESWGAIDQALLAGVRGLPGGSSIARLLAAGRGVRNTADVPKLEHWEILTWADTHFERAGRWPTARSGPIPEAPGETWSAVDTALAAGTRGLTGGESLARLLARRRGHRNSRALPPLTAALILAWADAHHRRTGGWPGRHSGPVTGRPGETWRAVESALRNGRRGLSGGSSLARLLAEARGVRNPSAVSALTVEQILGWADAFHARTGRWPTRAGGVIPEAPGETWATVADAVREGRRGMPASTSLPRLLTECRGARHHLTLPAFTVEQILAWADAHHARTGGWPGATAGAVEDAPGETWGKVDQALACGLRSLPGGDTLARLLARHRGRRNRKALPPLSLPQINTWVMAHVRRTGAWPRRDDGAIQEAPGETWAGVDCALRCGVRGLPGGSSLPRVVAECRATRPDTAWPSTRRC